MLKPGSKAPDFILPNENGEEVSLTDILETGPIVLYFYPADFTPGCTKEACAIRDMHDDILSVGLRVVGVSPQTSGCCRASDSTWRYRAENTPSRR